MCLMVKWYNSLYETHLRTTEHHLLAITQCYLPPNTGERALTLPQPDKPVLDLPTQEG